MKAEMEMTSRAILMIAVAKNWHTVAASTARGRRETSKQGWDTCVGGNSQGIKHTDL